MFDIQECLNEFNLTIEQYEQLLNDCNDKFEKKSDLDWSEISDKYNLNWNGDSLRKGFTPKFVGGAFIKQYFEEKYKSNNTISSDEYLKELELKKQEIKKEKQKLSDERIGLNKLLREQARKEELYNIVKRIIDDYQPIKFDYKENVNNVSSDSDMIIHLTDVHAGVDISSPLNTFNSDILVERIKNYLNEILDIKKTHNCENAYIILGGDMIHGIIHVNGRIEAKENIMQQLQIVSDIIGNFINELRIHFNNVYVYTTPGNHSRSTSSKDDALKGENFDLLIPYILNKQFGACGNVHIIDNSLDINIATFTVRGWNVYASHGDKDSPSSVVSNMTKLARKAKYPLPDICYLGHRHTNGYSNVDGVKVIQSGCCDGMDNYAIDNRFVGSPEQTVAIITEDKKVKAFYDVQLD